MTITRIDRGRRMSEAVMHGDTIYLAGQDMGSVDAHTSPWMSYIEVPRLFRRLMMPFSLITGFSSARTVAEI